MDRRPHLSATQISMFLRCPRQWAYRYVEHIKSPPSGAMKLGNVWHQALKRNYRQKVETKTDLPLDEMTDFFAETFDKEIESEEVIFDPGETAGKLKDQGVSVTTAHHTALAPTIQPVQVEQEDRFALAKNGFPYDLVTIIDLVDDAGRIRDSKSWGKTPNQSDLDRDIQLSTYALAYRIKEGKAEAGLLIDAVIKTKEPKAKTFETARNREGLKLHLNTIGHIAKAIHAEAFPPNPTGWWCSKKFCGYWDRCMGKAMVTVDLGQQLQDSIKRTRSQWTQDEWKEHRARIDAGTAIIVATVDADTRREEEEE